MIVLSMNPDESVVNVDLALSLTLTDLLALRHWLEVHNRIGEGRSIGDFLDGFELQWVDTNVHPNRILTFDECAALGLDGTGRQS